jgi:RNA polymerase sigma-70 factor (ECF subfamily)
MSANSISLHIFEVLATQHEPMLMSYLVSLVGDYALAEDVAQQSLVIAYRKIHTLKDPAAFPSWLRGIARLEGLAAMRRRRPYRKIHTLKDPAAFPSWLRGIARLEGLAAMRRRGREIPIAPEVINELDEVYRQFEVELPKETWEERFSLVEECFEKLPDTLQAVCRMHYFENHKAWQIAQRMALNLNTVLKRLERARTAIRDCVEERMAGEVQQT